MNDSNKKRSIGQANAWADPEYRKKMIEKQSAWRRYGTTILPRRKKI